MKIKSTVQKLVAVILLLLPYMLLNIATSYAANHVEAIISQQQTKITKGQTVEDVIVLGHDVTVYGNVSEILIVVNGNIHLMPSSKCWLVLDFGGAIQQEPGATVNSWYQTSYHSPFWNGVMLGMGLILFVWAVAFFLSIGLALVSILIVFFSKTQLDKAVENINRSVRRSGLTGVFVSFAVFAIGAVFAVTIVGIPISILLFILYGVAGIAGFSIVSLWVGKLMSRPSNPPRANWKQSLIGSSLVIAFVNVPFVGLLFFVILWLIGLGAITSWLSDMWPIRRKDAKR